jgi:hypothetical protein
MRLPRHAVFLLAGLFLLAAPQARGAAFPVLKAPALYAGEYRQGDNLFHVFLYLGEKHEFVIREKPAQPVSPETGWEETGTWYQIRGGAFLQLAGASGFRRLVNVGGRGNLYLGMLAPEGKQLTATLRPRDFLPEDLRQSLPAAQEDPALYTPGYFLDAVAEKRWKVTLSGAVDEKALPGVYSLTFLVAKGKTGGKLEIFDGARPVSGTYALHGNSLGLEAKVGDERLARIIRGTRSWRLVGEVLELRDENGALALLERMR